MEGAASQVWGPRFGWYAVWLIAAPFAVFGTWYALQVGLGYDSHAYWSAVQDMDHLYDTPALSRDAYLYSPLFAQVIWPLGRLSWPLFGILWSSTAAALFVWLLRPLPMRWFVPSLLATVPEILTGNIYALMASALVLGANRGTPWLFLGLTKVTPGLVGVVWLAVRRRWRPLAFGLGLGVLLVGVSVLANPTAWQQWVHLLSSGSSASDAGRSLPWLTLAWLGVALIVTGFAAATGRAWLLPVATIIASPTFGPNTVTLLAAIPRLSRSDRDGAARPSTP